MVESRLNHSVEPDLVRPETRATAKGVIEIIRRTVTAARVEPAGIAPEVVEMYREESIPESVIGAAEPTKRWSVPCNGVVYARQSVDAIRMQESDEFLTVEVIYDTHEDHRGYSLWRAVTFVTDADDPSMVRQAYYTNFSGISAIPQGGQEWVEFVVQYADGALKAAVGEI